jgi:hypothetical protein
MHPYPSTSALPLVIVTTLGILFLSALLSAFNAGVALALGEMTIISGLSVLLSIAVVSALALVLIAVLFDSCLSTQLRRQKLERSISTLSHSPPT